MPVSSYVLFSEHGVTLTLANYVPYMFVIPGQFSLGLGVSDNTLTSFQQGTENPVYSVFITLTEQETPFNMCSTILEYKCHKPK